MMHPDLMPQRSVQQLEFGGSGAGNRARSPSLVLTWDGRAPRAHGVHSCVLGGAMDAAGSPNRLRQGIFADWNWDGTRLQARNDRYGFQPLFYAVQDTTLWLSPSIPELVAQGAPVELDDAALAVFLRLTHFVGNDTPFLHIRALPPAAQLTWQDGRCRVDGSRAERPMVALTRDVAINRYTELFHAALAKDTIEPARTVVPLSGGRDSRHILLGLHAAGTLPAECVTVRPAPPQAEDDLTVARMVATALGVPHVTIPTTTDRLGDEIAKNWRTSLGVSEHFWEMGVVRYATGRNLVIYDGIAGDVLSESKYMSAERLSAFRSRALRQYAEAELYGEAYLPALLEPKMYQRFSRGLAIERLEAELQTHVDSHNPVRSYRFWNRTRRAVALAPFGMLSDVATVRAPYLDHDLYDFLASLPVELLVDRTFHSETIARSYPAFSAIPYERAGAVRPSARSHMLRYGLSVLRAELRTARRTFSRGESGGIMRHGAYVARIAALLGVPARVENVGSVATLGTYLGQLELLTEESVRARTRHAAR